LQTLLIENPTRDRIRRLIKTSQPHDPMGDFEFQFDSEGTFAVVYRQGDVILAGAITVITKDWAYVETVWVDESLRGQGIGRKLMRAVESYVHQIGLNGILLYTIDFQAPEFYLKLGYELLGKLPNRPHGYDATYYIKTDFVTDALTSEFTVENPVTETSFDIIEDGLTQHAAQYETIVVHERLIEVQDADGRVCGGMFGHEFWGYLDIHLLYANDTDTLKLLLERVNQYCDDHQIGIVTHAFSTEQWDMLVSYGYEIFGELPDRPTGVTCKILVYPQPSN